MHADRPVDNTPGSASSGIPDEPPVARADSRVLDLVRELSRIGATAGDRHAAAQSALDAIASGLEPGAGIIKLAEHDEEGALWLVHTAHVGTHAPFLQDSPPIAADSDYEAAKVFRDGVADFHAEDYGETNGNGDTGPGRWRSSIAFRSSATLPLVAGEESLGTLTLHWSEEHEFDSAHRSELETVASVTALALAHAGSAASPTDADTPIPDAPMAVGLLRFGVTSHGAIVPKPPGSEWSEREALRIVVHDRTGEESTAWADAAVPSPGRCACVVVRLPGAASELPGVEDALRDLAIAALEDDVDAAGTLRALDDAAHTALPPEATADALVAVLDGFTGALEWCAAGQWDMTQLGVDGRRWHESSDQEVDTLPAACGLRIVMPGDRVHLTVGNEVDLHLTRVS